LLPAGHRHITMVCDDLDAIPEFLLDAPYCLRWFRPGDEQHWLDIQSRADIYNEFSLALFQGTFGSALRELPQRLCFLTSDDGTPIGTATAWFGETAPWQGCGRLHWVAISPEQQGRGLSKPLLAEVCRMMRRLNGPRAYLTTATCRLPAVNLYSQFGFRPQMSNADERQAWSLLLANDGAKGLMPRLRDQIAVSE